MFTGHKFLLVTAKQWLKSVLNYRSYPKNKTGIRFWTTLYIVNQHCYLQPKIKAVGIVALCNLNLKHVMQDDERERERKRERVGSTDRQTHSVDGVIEQADAAVDDFALVAP